MEEHAAFTWLSSLHLPVPENTLGAIFVSALLVVFGLRVRSKLANVDGAVEPEDGVTARNVAEVFVEAIGGMAEGVIGHHWERYMPLLAAFFSYILLSNLLGLVPGFVPPTSNFNTTLGLGVVSFLAYNLYGMREHGPKYLKHFLGPVIFLAPLMLPIELFSHSFRPISLGIRLFANMFADHAVVGIFTDLTKAGIPVLFYLLGAFVCVVQAFVFTMLSAIYITLAVSHDH
jgi:F-type H+-transporting ATPase subunit a